MSSLLPKLVLDLAFTCDGWIVGSAADPLNSEPRDYDIIIPFSSWQNACMFIPPNAVPNHFGGWKCMSENIEVDVWPGELSWIMQNNRMKYVYHPKSGIRWIKI